MIFRFFLKLPYSFIFLFLNFLHSTHRIEILRLSENLPRYLSELGIPGIYIYLSILGGNSDETAIISELPSSKNSLAISVHLTWRIKYLIKTFLNAPA